ncbi:MAG: PIG-L deacetylase family protein [Chloroflexota bacterium]
MSDDIHQPSDSPKRALVIMAHPDDAEFTCAGTLARWVRAGWLVHYVVCTSGDKGTKNHDMTPHHLAAIREEEQLAAARVLGVETITFLRHKDGELEATKEFRAELAMLIRRYRPHRVVTHDAWRPYQLHPDHRAVGITTCDAIVAARDHLFLPGQTAIGLEAVEPEELYLWGAAEPDYFEDISETLEVKLEALTQHESQLRRPNWRQRIIDWASETGKPQGMAYAEAFKRISFRH